MKLLIIRQGESEADILNVHEGRADFSLTEHGHKQAAAMSEYIAETYKISRIYHSTLKRAKQTAQHLAEKTGAELTPCKQLMEFNNGLLAGLSHEEADSRYPYVEVPLHMSKYEQESAVEFRARAEYMLSKLLSENGEDDTIAVVTHGGMINQLYRAFFRLPLDSDYIFYTGDTGIHVWIADGESRILVRANFSAHNI